MNPRLNQSVTLLELIIALVLLSVIVVGFSSIDLFSRHHLITSEKRARLQNEVSYILGNMDKQISLAIGNEKIDSEGVVAVETNNKNVNLKVFIENLSSPDGVRTGNDYWIAYNFYGNDGFYEQYQLRYCGRCQNKLCAACSYNWQTLSKNITKFVPYKPTTDNTLSDNYVDIELTACSDPKGSLATCGSIDNPSVTMRTRIKMPAVSTH